MALKYKYVTSDAPVPVAGVALTNLLALLASLGIPAGTACELRVWFEGPTTADPRDGVLTAQAKRVASSAVAVGAPPPGTFEIFNG